MKSRNAAFFAIVSVRVEVLFPRCGVAEFIATRESTAREEIVDFVGTPREAHATSTR